METPELPRKGSNVVPDAVMVPGGERASSTEEFR